MQERKLNKQLPQTLDIEDLDRIRDGMLPQAPETFEDRFHNGLTQILRTADAYAQFTADNTYLYLSRQADNIDFGVLFKVVEDGNTKIYDIASIREAVNKGEVIKREDRESGRTAATEKALREKFSNEGKEIPDTSAALGAFGALSKMITPKDTPLPLLEISELREDKLYGFIEHDVYSEFVEVFQRARKQVPTEIFAHYDANTRTVTTEMGYTLGVNGAYKIPSNADHVQTTLLQWAKNIAMGINEYSQLKELGATDKYIVKLPEGALAI